MLRLAVRVYIGRVVAKENAGEPAWLRHVVPNL